MASNLDRLAYIRGIQCPRCPEFPDWRIAVPWSSQWRSIADPFDGGFVEFVVFEFFEREFLFELLDVEQFEPVFEFVLEQFFVQLFQLFQSVEFERIEPEFFQCIERIKFQCIERIELLPQYFKFESVQFFEPVEPVEFFLVILVERFEFVDFEQYLKFVLKRILAFEFVLVEPIESVQSQPEWCITLHEQSYPSMAAVSGPSKVRRPGRCHVGWPHNCFERGVANAA